MIILRDKQFTSVLMPGFKVKDIKDLDDKQLEHVSKYKYNKNVRNKSIGVSASFTVPFGLLGYYLTGKGLKGAALGATVGAGLGTALSIAGNAKHKKEAKEAKEELERRRSK